MHNSLKTTQQNQQGNVYDNPIPDRAFILGLLEKVGTQLNRSQLAQALKLTDDDQREALRRRLRAMERDGQLTFDKQNGYGLIKPEDLQLGRVIGHRDGYGFVALQQGGQDLVLHRNQMRRVIDGDEVQVVITGTDQRGRKEARIIKIVEHNTTEVVGKLRMVRGQWRLIPENRKISCEIHIQDGSLTQDQTDQYILAEITQYPDHRNPCIATIVEIMGDAMAPGMEIEIALRNHDIPDCWPDDVIACAAKLGSKVVPEDKTHRVDLSSTPFVTIDGEDAKDFDDAVYCRVHNGGWKLWVAIADVSHYVLPDTTLDIEAQSRATSVYFPGYVVPMLPESISNGLCSLNPNVDRLVMVCEMHIDAKGTLGDYRFFEGVINSHARLTYTQVGALLEQPQSSLGRQVAKEYHELLQPLTELHKLYKALRVSRLKRGAIDFDTHETRIIFNEQRKIDKIVPVIRNDAHKLIEECMLCANVATARFLEKLKIPALYRNHEGPQLKKLTRLREFLGELGLNLSGGEKPTPTDYSKLVEQIAERPDASIIQTMLLRSLNQAAYGPNNVGHFGLAFEAYAHFTSPIRRYPDLLVHRAIRSVIRSKESGNLLQRTLKSVIGKGLDPVQRLNSTPKQGAGQLYPYNLETMLALGEHCSQASRSADEASWEVDAWLKCEYMQSHVGDEFDGIINSVTNFGLFIELPETHIEGLVHITSLHGDFYHFDSAKQRLIGEKSRVSYRLGDKVKVRVAKVDLDQRQIEFELAGAPPKNTSRTRKKPTRR